MKLNKDERRAIVSTIQRRLEAENDAALEQLEAAYKPSKRYQEAERILKEAQAAMQKFTDFFGSQYCHSTFSDEDIEYRLSKIRSKEINFQPRAITDSELEDRIILASLNTQSDIDAFIEEIMKAI